MYQWDSGICGRSYWPIHAYEIHNGSWIRSFLEWAVMCSNISRNVQLDTWFVILCDSNLQCNAVSLNVSNLCCWESYATVLLNHRLSRGALLHLLAIRILYSCGWVLITNSGVLKSWSITFNRMCPSYQHVLVSPNIISNTFTPCNLCSWNIVENSIRMKYHWQVNLSKNYSEFLGWLLKFCFPLLAQIRVHHHIVCTTVSGRV
jgi:hypothetical protein